MSSAQDPFYIVKEEIQDSIDKLQSTFHQWERIPANSQEQQQLTKTLLVGCESIEWQVDELDKTIAVAARDPGFYGIDESELDKRRRWTSSARMQVGNVKKTIAMGRELDITSTSNANATRRELMRLSESHQAHQSNHYGAQHNDDFISSESDRQLLLVRQQDEELDELSASVERIGDVGLTIHEELLAQEKIIDDLGMEMESTSNRLDFVQKLKRNCNESRTHQFHLHKNIKDKGEVSNQPSEVIEKEEGLITYERIRKENLSGEEGAADEGHQSSSNLGAIEENDDPLHFRKTLGLDAEGMAANCREKGERLKAKRFGFLGKKIMASDNPDLGVKKSTSAVGTNFSPHIGSSGWLGWLHMPTMVGGNSTGVTSSINKDGGDQVE